MRVFVFGSNLRGIHGAGAAKDAVSFHGAHYGCGIGPQGNAYAIPTKDEKIKTLPLDRIRGYVSDFLLYAASFPELEFQVTRIGCGLAGYKDRDIAPFFKDAPKNCLMPPEWIPLIGGKTWDESANTVRSRR